MEQAKRFVIGVGWVFFSSVATLLIGTLLRIVLARWLGPDNLGLYQMVITIQGVAALVATFGIPMALTKYVAEYKDDRDKLTQTTSSGFISSIIFGVVAGIQAVIKLFRFFRQSGHIRHYQDNPHPGEGRQWSYCFTSALYKSRAAP